MNSPVFNALVPVIVFIGLGFGVARVGWIRSSAVKDLSNLVFMLLTPALLFRTMSAVQVQSLDFAPVAVYFLAAGLVFAATLLLQGFTALAAARALACTFGNTIMIGIPLVGLAFGEAGLVTLFTLIAVHALVLLTAATVVFELASARSHALSSGAAQHGLWRTVAQALWSGILHPVPLPILLGLAFAQTGLVVPAVLDKPLQLLGQALGPMALLLVGVTLAFSTVGSCFWAALRIALVKNLVLPAVLAGCGWALGLRGLPLAVMVVASSLPVGANVFLFAQRYAVAQGEVTASVALSTALALLTLPVVLLAVVRWLV